MYKLTFIKSLCDGCEGKVKKCEELLPGLLSQPDGFIFISRRSTNSEERIEAAKSLVKCCSRDAIRLRGI